MKTILSLLSAGIIALPARSQQEPPHYKIAADSFEARYNTGQFEAIYASFSPEMQEHLPVGQTRTFLNGLKEQAGTIIKKSFAGYDQSMAVYKTQFERALLSVNLSLNDAGQINGLLVKPFTEINIARPERNTTKMALPFKGEWTVIWGGDTKELNYHVESEAQKNAFDIVVTDASGSSHKNDGTKNEDYYAFGKELFATCDGEVVLVVDGIKDNVPGVLNPVYVPGNTVIIRTAANEYVFFAHFKQHSISVKQGEKVKRGQLLGRCGNSGNSSEPHLHFHLQNMEDMTTATGIKCFFDNLNVNGNKQHDYSPVKDDKISAN
ncbi:peptidoglycan DD-metalloendopeptidase family protein [Rurimicrobium arvi]|uniref:Peptidase M23 n=1 Tax=Rurimicrobium arvi TaxID=2049916 RepID=A0ABP8N2Q0_9BACT